MITGTERVLLAILLIVLMMGMGATLTRAAFANVLKRPRGVVIGLLSQFGWMPLVAFGLGHVFGLAPTLALGLLVVGATPGGTTSNLFTYFSGADVALSIAMTVVSTAVAVVVMPLMIGLYAQGLDGLTFAVPLGSIAATLGLVLVPVAIGMAIRSKSESAARKVERAGSACGILVIALLVVSAMVNNYELFMTIPLAGYAAAALLGVVGILLGFLGGSLARLPVPQRVAVALETGIQNTPLAFAVIIATLPEDQVDEALHLPVLYALCILITASIASLVFRKFSKSAPEAEPA